VDPRWHSGKVRFGHDSCRSPRFQLNGGVSPVADNPDTGYRLAPALGLRLVGRSLVSLGVVVVVVTLFGLLFDIGWVFAGAVTLIGLVLVAAWAWWLFQHAVAVRLTDQGYAVSLLGGVGTAAASWSEVGEVVAASPGGTPCLVIRLTDGRGTRLPMTALAGDPDAFALDVRRRVRNAHSTSPGAPDQPSDDATDA
jgi:hypothetical protein